MRFLPGELHARGPLSDTGACTPPPLSVLSLLPLQFLLSELPDLCLRWDTPAGRPRLGGGTAGWAGKVPSQEEPCFPLWEKKTLPPNQAPRAKVGGAAPQVPKPSLRPPKWG